MSIGGRCTHRIANASGANKVPVVDHGYYLKSISMNPYLGTVHDGTSIGYLQGFQKKHMHWLTRFRYNQLPAGMVKGLLARNKLGKHVHFLEVSTIEKFRLRLFDEECRPLLHCIIVSLIFIFWRSYNLIHNHPDLSYYNVALYTTKPWVQQFRFRKMRIDEPSYRFIVRSPELYIEDPIRQLYELGVMANDPYLEYCKAKGVEKDLLVRKWAPMGATHPPHILPIKDLPPDTAGGHLPTFARAEVSKLGKH